VKYLLLSLVSLLFASCAKDLNHAAIDQEPAPDLSPVSKAVTKEPMAADKPANRPAIPNKPAEGIRLPDDILALPQDDQLRSAPTVPKDGKGTLIVRPPEE
jgi:hypothetical protein